MKSRARSASSESVSSKSSFDSDLEVTLKNTAPSRPQPSKAAKNAKKATPAKSSQKKKEPPVTKASLGISSDSEIELKMPRSTRRQTRGNNVRKSKFLTGKTMEESGSETEATQLGESSTPASPRKRMNSSSKADVKTQANGGIAASLLPVRRDKDGLPPIEHRKCPITGCDSSGHLNGKLDRHFTAEACPVYHNTTKQRCQSLRSEVTKKNNQRRRALTSLATKSPQGSPSGDQKRHYQHVSTEPHDCVCVASYSMIVFA